MRHSVLMTAGVTAIGAVAFGALGGTPPAGNALPGDVLVCDFNVGNIHRFDSEGNFVDIFIFDGAGAMHNPHAMFIGPDMNGDSVGDLFAISTSTGIHLFDSQNGDKINGGLFANWPALDADFGPDRNGDGVEDLYILKGGDPIVIWVDGVTGAFGGNWVTAANGGGLSAPEFITWGPDVNRDGVSDFLLSSLNLPDIWRYDGATGGFMDLFFEGPGDINFVDGRDMVFRNGLLYVASGTDDSVVTIDQKTGEAQVLVPPGAANMDNPHGLQIGPDANGDGLEDIWIAACFSASVPRFDGITGEMIDFFVSPFEGGLTSAAQLVFLPSPVMGDLNGDGQVGATDLLLLLGAWGRCDDCGDCIADIDNDCVVATDDLIILLGNWGM